MEIRRFFVDSSCLNGDSITITGDEFWHLKKVLRIKVGFKIIVCFNDGYEYDCIVSEISDSYALAKVVEKRFAQDKLCNITLYAALLKGGKLDFVIQKCVELGIKNVTPFLSQNVVETKFSLDRGNRISFEAAKQCGSAFLSTVNDVISFDKMLDELSNFDEVCFFYEDEKALSIEDVKLTGKKIAIVIGSEGGFTPNEVKLAKNKGAKIVSLGKRILRAETASIVAASMVLYKLGAFKL